MKNSLEKYTYPFFETIRVVEGDLKLLDFHQRRIDHVFRYFYPSYQAIKLSKSIQEFSTHQKHVAKLRFEYNSTSFNYTIQPYTIRTIKKLVLTETDINYPFKWSDRKVLNNLTASVANDEDTLLVSQGRIRETSYANVILQFGEEWLTPMYPIFHGVMRSHLLASGVIKSSDLFVGDLRACDRIMLVNAMMPMEAAIALAISNVVGLK